MLIHQLSLSDDAIKRVVSFLGYGRLSAPVWFIGLEEGLGDANDDKAITNLDARGYFKPTMDLVDAHRTLRENGQLISIETKTKFTQVWTFMAKIMRARAGEADWPDIKAANAYVRKHLGRQNGETFLTELSPIPRSKPSHKFWIDRFQKRLPNLTSLLEKRRKELNRLYREHTPSLAICYGATARLDFQRLLSLEAWETIATIGKRPIVIEATVDRRVLCLPFFGNGQMSHAVIQTLLDEGILRSN